MAPVETREMVEPSVLLALAYAPQLLSAPYLMSRLRLAENERSIYLFDSRSVNGSVTVIGIGDEHRTTVRRMFVRLVGKEGFRMPRRFYTAAKLGLVKEDLLGAWEGVGYYQDAKDRDTFLNDFDGCTFYDALPALPEHLKLLPALD